MAILYLHKRKDNNEVFYIGIGKTKRRAYRKDQRSKYWISYTNKYKYYVEILCDNISWEEACNKEKELICFYGRKDLGFGNLINMTDGGEGGFGRVLSDVHKRKISDYKKRESKDVFINCQKKAWDKNRGRKLTDEHKSKISKPIIQLDLDGNHIKEYISGIEAFRQTKITHINSVASGKRKTAGGYRWIFKKDYETR